MFQLLRLNSLIYIFYKGNNPRIEIGYVNNYPVPKPKYNVPFNAVQLQEMVVDLSVKVGELLINFNQLPANSDIADSFTNGEHVVVSANRDAINQDVLAFKLKSQDILNSIEAHQSIITLCDKILNDLNPEYAERKLQLDEICNLKSLVTEMSSKITTLTELLTQLTKKEK